MKIAICDDDADQAKVICETLIDMDKSSVFEIKSFDNPMSWNANLFNS